MQLVHTFIARDARIGRLGTRRAIVPRMSQPGQIRVIEIPRATPRDPALLKVVHVGSMQVVWALVYWMLILGGLSSIPLALVVLSKLGDTQAADWIMLATTSLQLVLGLWLRRRTRATRRARELALLEGVACPARLLGTRRALGVTMAMMKPSYMHTFHVQMPDGRVLEHQVKLPLEYQEPGEGRELFALVHEGSEGRFILIPDMLMGARHRLVDEQAD